MSLSKEETVNLVRLLCNEDYISTAVEMIHLADYKTFVNELIKKTGWLKYKDYRVAYVFYKHYKKELWLFISKKVDKPIGFKYTWYSNKPTKKEKIRLYKSGSLQLLNIDKSVLLRNIQLYLKDIMEEVDQIPEDDI